MDVATGMAGSRSMLVVGAHAADFVWRAAGAIALHTASGGSAVVVALSYGERGESGDLWAVPDQTVDNVKHIRFREAQEAADALGATFEAFDLGDYPLLIDDAAIDRLVGVMIRTAPDVILTHVAADPGNPDHPVAHAAVDRARKLAMGAAGVPSAFPTIPPPNVFLFEPHQPELSGFMPNTYVDITSVLDRKQKAMEAMASQSYLRDHYGARAAQRAAQARYAGLGKEATAVEAFQRVTPEVRARL